MPAPLKDNLDRQTVELLADQFARQYDGFDPDAFTEALLDEFPTLELKDRINLIADRLASDLPADYESALAMVVQVAEDGVDGWAAWPLCSFVERHGVESPVASLDAMAPLTKRWSCEFAIRPFLQTHLELTRDYLREWVLDPDEAVRRLPSEGTRPLLPWGPKVPALLDDPEIGLELLRALRHDESATVRRSVANHLNDVAKSEPDLVIDMLTQWSSEPEPVDERMVRHALRTLIKKGNPGALALLGFTTEPDVTVNQFTCQPCQISLGEDIDLTAELTSTSQQEQLLVIDFIIHHVRATGATSPKVFKWTTERLAPADMVRLSKRRRIQTASTRRYHAGEHRVDLQIAGEVVASTHFNLDESS
jgi:3-methyladenine DNA glycosylase AlkC